jgi:SnoaL-like polyketide cyclase
MSAEANKEIVRRVIEEGVNRQDLSVFDELISPSFVDYEADGSGPGGSEGEKELLSSVRESFPDWRWEIQDMLAAEDKVITRYVARRTLRVRRHSVLCAVDHACVLVQIGSAGAEMIRTLLPFVLRVHSPAAPPGFFLQTLKDIIVWDA